MTARFSDTDPDRTWDGLAVATEDPRGTTVVVRRPGAGGFEFLLLHRASRGVDYEGDWAWTAPAGARQPEEPVLPSALRELAEEAGLTGVELRPVDLSGRWAVFAADVPAGTSVELVDPEHDRYEWVPLAVARDRVLPSWVAAGNFGPVAGRAVPRIGFRPMTDADLPALVGWRAQPHVRTWFRRLVPDVAAARTQHGARIAGESHVRMRVLELDDRPVGYLQHFLVGDEPEYDAVVRDPGAVAMDYLIGDPELTGRGLGPQVIWRYVLDCVLQDHPGAPRVVASPEPVNTASIRALEKAGFAAGRILTMPGSAPPEQLCTFDVARILG